MTSTSITLTWESTCWGEGSLYSMRKQGGKEKGGNGKVGGGAGRGTPAIRTQLFSLRPPIFAYVCDYVS